VVEEKEDEQQDQQEQQEQQEQEQEQEQEQQQEDFSPEPVSGHPQALYCALAILLYLYPYYHTRSNS
jgi:hypothetical protein